MRLLATRSKVRCVREWKRSWWVGLTLVPLGLLAWSAFVYVGVRAARARWVVYGIAYLAAEIVGYGLAQSSSTGDIGGGVIIFAWLVPLAHALAIRSDVDWRIAARAPAELREAEQRQLARQRGRKLADADPRRARELGVGRPDQQGFDAGLVDLNNAPWLVISRLPGVDDTLAKRIVAVREEIGGFSSLNDLGEVLELDAATIDRLRPEVVVLPRD